LSNLLFKAIKGISCEIGDAFFVEILFPVISDLIDLATDQEGNAMAKSHYQFKKRQKELAKKKKKEEKRQRKLENKAIETDETEKDPTPSTKDR